mgnify:CR=1 FL=1
MKKNELLKKGFNLQMFADGSGAGAGTGTDAKGGAEPNANGTKGKDGTEPKEPEGKNKDKSGEKKYSDDDVNDIVNKKFAIWKSEHEKEVAEAKAEAEKLAKMNADQKKDYEIEKLKAENEKYKALQVRTELGKEASKQLKEKNIDATAEILDFVVGENAEATSKNIDSFVAIIEKQLALKEAERAKGKTPSSYNQGDQRTLSEFEKRIAKYK